MAGLCEAQGSAGSAELAQCFAVSHDCRAWTALKPTPAPQCRPIAPYDYDSVSYIMTESQA